MFSLYLWPQLIAIDSDQEKKCFILKKKVEMERPLPPHAPRQYTVDACCCGDGAGWAKARDRS